MRAVQTLRRLRWFALLGQAVVILSVHFLWQAPLPLWPITIVLVIFAATNLVISDVVLRNVLGGSGRFAVAHSEGARNDRLPNTRPPERWASVCGAVTVLDVTFLTVLLGLCGGPANPFSVLYLVHVMLAAVITTRWWARGVVLASSVGFACLFLYHVPLPPKLGGHHMMVGAQDGSYSIHLQGMWLAYTISAIVIAEIVSGVSIALKQEREKQAHSSRFLGLAALAAGAAHELGNPLGTIRLAASELELAGRKETLPDNIIDDIRLINQETLRAQAVLHRLSASAGELRGEALRPMSLGQFVASLGERLESERLQITINIAGHDAFVQWPIEAMSQALTQLVSNAVQASAALADSVTCDFIEKGEHIEVRIRDQGVGMDKQVLARISEPFFTTRGASGMGLGVFIARSLIEDMGGELNFISKVGEGTTATACIPKVQAI